MAKCILVGAIRAATDPWHPSGTGNGDLVPLSAPEVSVVRLADKERKRPCLVVRDLRRRELQRAVAPEPYLEPAEHTSTTGPAQGGEKNFTRWKHLP